MGGPFFPNFPKFLSEHPKIVKNGPNFKKTQKKKKKKKKTGYPFLPKWPLKMGMGFKALVA